MTRKIRGFHFYTLIGYAQLTKTAGYQYDLLFLLDEELSVNSIRPLWSIIYGLIYDNAKTKK